VHVLMALLGQEETVVVPVLQKVGANVTRLREAVTCGGGAAAEADGRARRRRRAGS
jgi:hypothetical protein